MVKKMAKKTDVKQEWEWINGYKGTDENMCCRGFQYELGKRFDMPENEEIRICESGFHVCESLGSVFDFYPIGNNHRFFEVRALVPKKEEKEENDEPLSDMDRALRNLKRSMFFGNSDKLAAKSIEFVREVSIDEIFQAAGLSSWSDKHKQLALEKGTVSVRKVIKELEKEKQIQDLFMQGYSMEIAKFVIKKGMFELAYALGTQKNISMDTRISVLFKKGE